MSIATLKRKTQAQYNNMSVGLRGFSLNGIHRNQGYVGQTSLSRSLPKTPMKGNVPKGHGGSGGKFVRTPIIQSGVISLENLHEPGTALPNVVKKSVINTMGMIENAYMWRKRPYPFATVKPDNNRNVNNQQSYISNLSRKTIANVADCTTVKNNTSNSICRNADTGLASCISHTKNTQMATNDKIMSQEQYLLQLNKKCGVDDFAKIPKNIGGTPFACGVSK